MPESLYTAAKAEKRLQSLAHQSSSAIEYGVESIEKFAKRLTSDDPARVMEWSIGTFTDAAAVTLHRRVLLVIEHGRTDNKSAAAILADLHHDAHAAMLSGARYPSHSTSAAVNILNEALTAAWAELYAKLDRWAKDGD